MVDKNVYVVAAILGALGLAFLFKKKVTTPIVPDVTAAVSEFIPTTCQERAIQLAIQQTGLPREQLVVRSLIPSDFGLTTWSLNLSSANAWNSGVINTNIADNRFCCITGISYAGTAAEQVRIRVGSSTVAQFSIQHVTGITTTHHIDITPILAQQNLPIQTDIYASAISATDEVIFEGITVEPVGLLISP